VNSLLVASNDAGGAEILSAWIKSNQDQFDISYWLAGPAVNVFNTKLPALTFYQDGLEGIGAFDQVLTSTSWSTNHEKTVIKKARQLNIPVSTYLDHWMAFKQRFQLDDEIVLPDELWVGDIYAEHLARVEFPDTKIVSVPNLYMQELVNEIKEAGRTVAHTEPRILYVTEPTSVVALTRYGNKDFFGYTEFSALDKYLAYIDKQAIEYETIRIRPHPSEPTSKYDRYLQNDHFRIELSFRNSLIEDCAWSDWVVGCQSMAMAIAVNAGKQVFSCLPDGVESALPFPEIKKIFQS
jgi:hypothetical protein